MRNSPGEPEELSCMADQADRQKSRQGQENSPGGDVPARRKREGDIAYGPDAGGNAIHCIGTPHAHGRLAVDTADLPFAAYFVVFFKG